MTVYWLEQAFSEVPAGTAWLNAREARHLGGLRFPKRRADWLLGRWTAKRAVALCYNPAAGTDALAAVEIRAARSGAPEVFLGDDKAGVSISLSHSDGHAVCAVALGDVTLGCDIETIADRPAVFLADYFTPAEQDLVYNADEPRALTETLLWSAKESALKALQTGLRLDTRAVEVSYFASDAPSDRWQLLRVRHPGGVFRGWWRADEAAVHTVLAAPACSPPRAIAAPASAPRHTVSGACPARPDLLLPVLR